MDKNTPEFPELPEVARIESSQGARSELDMYVTSITNNTPAPLQGELYELREKFSVLRDDKNEVITRLKRLTKDYQRLLRLTPDIDDSANIASWQAYKEELTKRAEQLLGGE